MSDLAAVISILVAVGQWLVLLAWMIMKPKAKRQSAFAISSAFVAIIVLLLAPSGAQDSSSPSSPALRGEGCATVREGMHLLDVREAMGDPLEIVDEQDTQGPNSQALVYPGCVAHVLNGRVRAVDYE